MAFYYGLQQQQQQHHHHSSHHQPSSHSHGNHHGGRSRRGPRLSSQNSHRPFRGVRSMKELAEAPPSLLASRARFEACKGFDLDDDLEFCPSLLTEDDLFSISSSASDRSSLSSGSPSSSPLQQQIQPSQQISPPFSLASSYSSYQAPTSATAPPPPQLKIHQPAAVRSRNAIPIVNPSTGMRVPSPPQSVSPGRMQQQAYGRRW